MQNKIETFWCTELLILNVSWAPSKFYELATILQPNLVRRSADHFFLVNKPKVRKPWHNCCLGVSATGSSCGTKNTFSIHFRCFKLCDSVSPKMENVTEIGFCEPLFFQKIISFQDSF